MGLGCEVRKDSNMYVSFLVDTEDTSSVEWIIME